MITSISKWERTVGRLRHFIFNNPELTALEKTITLASFNKQAALRKILLKRLESSASSDEYFQINGFHLFFEPDFAIRDRDYFLDGITQILKESFILPDLFLSKVKIQEGDTVLDLGAAIGSTSLIFSRLAGVNGKIVAFEPITHKVIQKNALANSIGNIQVLPFGVSDKSGKAEIEQSDFCVDSSICKRSYTKDYYTGRRIIEVISLDDFISQNTFDKIDFIKMDIEGAEELALRGAKKMIDKYRPKWSIASYHIDFNNQPQHSKLVSLLIEYGYNIIEDKNQHIYAY